MTVSRVLRNYPSVSDATREKVLRAIEQTGYRINPMVSAFMRYVRHTHSIPATEDIACLSMKPAATVSEEHPALNKTQLLQGAKERAAEIGFGLEVIEVGPRGVGFRRAEEIIRARGIRGIIITPDAQSAKSPPLEMGKLLCHFHYPFPLAAEPSPSAFRPISKHVAGAKRIASSGVLSDWVGHAFFARSASPLSLVCGLFGSPLLLPLRCSSSSLPPGKMD